MAEVGIPAECPPAVSYSSKTEFGDLQINGAMGAAKKLKTNPRDLATKIIAHLDIDGICDRVELAGPGFINLFICDSWLANYAGELAESEFLGVEKTASPQTVVVDYSSPNVAKEMHVGHLRGTVIGDTIVRILEFLGHDVIRQNHIGDWGTQFGMLIAELERQSNSTGTETLRLDDLEKFYRQSKAHFDADPSFAEKARDYVVKLQSGDQRCLELWQQFIDVSLAHTETIYDKLSITLQREDVRGESAYNAELPSVVADLVNAGLVVEDQGAKIAFLEELADKKGNPSPAIVQKADGGYLYATSDLAAIRYRVNTLSADRILYLIDERQSLHLKQVFTLARKAGWVPDSVELLHCAYGTMMGKDGRPFKTRSGDTVKLADLLVEATERAEQVVTEKNPAISEQDRANIAEIVGIGAVKYADLSITRTNDYIFDWETMLSFEGNTAPYLQYAYARIQSIFRKAGLQPDELEGSLELTSAAERHLILTLSRFAEVVEQVGIKGYPHELCHYLFELSGRFMHFYESCPILKDSVEPSIRDSRLRLADWTARAIKRGLELMGIETLERM